MFSKLLFYNENLNNNHFYIKNIALKAHVLASALLIIF